MILLNDSIVHFSQFPNGETYADCTTGMLRERGNRIYFRYENDGDIFQLMCVKDFVDENSYLKPCHLIMPYVPYSRMDRQEEDRLFTLKSFSKIINSMNFETVTILEPHSEVSSALIDRVVVKNMSSELTFRAMMKVLGLKGTDWLKYEPFSDEDFTLKGLFRKAREAGVYLVYPDAGAEKRYSKQIKYDKVLTCTKHRDFNTGNIDSIILNGAEQAQDCKIAIIVDDLCSKGGTFIGTAVELRNKIPEIEQVILCVTHCENTIYQGKVLSGIEIDKVFTTNSILTIPDIPDPTNYNRDKLEVYNV